jgi:hypothetical protein
MVAHFDHVCRNREDEPEDWREDAHPSAPRVQGEPEEGAEHASKHRVAAEPEKRVPGAELQSVRGESVFRVTLSHIQCRLEPIESCADKGPVNDPILIDRLRELWKDSGHFYHDDVLKAVGTKPG